MPIRGGNKTQYGTTAITPLCNFAHFPEVNEVTGFSEVDPGCRMAVLSVPPRQWTRWLSGQAEGSKSETAQLNVVVGLNKI